ncbi:hypothetical protein D3C87_266210 [compost metagenome]
MHETIFTTALILILSLGYIIISKIADKRLHHQKLVINYQKKRRIFLSAKVRQLFEVETKHQQNLKILESEVAQLQEDIAFKHNNGR